MTDTGGLGDRSVHGGSVQNGVMDVALEQPRATDSVVSGAGRGLDGSGWWLCVPSDVEPKEPSDAMGRLVRS